MTTKTLRKSAPHRVAKPAPRRSLPRAARARDIAPAHTPVTTVDQIGVVDPLLVGRAHLVYERGECHDGALL